MKRILQIFLFLLLIPIVANAESLTIKNIELMGKSEYVENADITFEGLNVSLDNKFVNIGDFVKYKIYLQNNEDEDIKVDLVTGDDKYIDYILVGPDVIEKGKTSELVLMVIYRNELDSNYYEKNDELGFDVLIKTSTVLPDVPNTLDTPELVFISLLVLALCVYGLVIIFHGKSVKYIYPLYIGVIFLAGFLVVGKSYANVALTINSHTIIEPKTYLYNIIKKESLGSSENINFNVSSDYAENNYTDESPYANKSGVYQLKEDESVYFYRGNVLNNNVIFGGFCWRIVRTTNTGGIKIIFNGFNNDGVCNSDSNSIGIAPFNERYDYHVENLFYNPDIVSYTYLKDDKETDSFIKSVIDNWYSNVLINYNDYIEDTVYCNDRQTVSYDSTKLPANEKLYDQIVYNYLITDISPGVTDYRKNIVYDSQGKTIPQYITFKNAQRSSYYSLNVNPSLECSKEDSYTVSKEYGNGKLTYPIGLLTSDEIVLAGFTSSYDSSGNTKGISAFNQNNYLNNNSSMIVSMSPIYLDENNAGISILAGNYYLPLYAYNDYDVRPVISLKSSTEVISGDGTINNPYIIKD